MKKSFLILLCICLCTIGVFATDFSYVHDGADLYTDTEEAEILDAAKTVYQNSGLLCVIVTDYGIGDMLDLLPAYAGSAEDMALLTIDMSAREFELYQYNATEGESAFRISSAESDTILDGILPDMADGNYIGAALTFLKLTEESYSNAAVFDPDAKGDDYTYQDYPAYEDEDGLLIIFFLVPLLIGMLAGGITVLCVRGAYKRKVHGTIYPLGQFAKLNVTDSKDTFVTKNVVVTRIPDPPSGGGGGGGGSRGGGGGARMGGRSF